MLEFPIKGYKDAESFADKIDWEGGIPGFFLQYSGESFEGTSLEKPLRNFRNAYNKIQQILEESGAVL